MSKVGSLKKVTVVFRTGSARGAMERADHASDFVFIYGIGTAGLTPFETLLNNREESEEISFVLAKADAKSFFGHLTAPLGGLLDGDDEQGLYVRIDRVETPQPRDVIRAMAEMVSHGHDGGCDCGCGCG